MKEAGIAKAKITFNKKKKLVTGKLTVLLRNYAWIWSLHYGTMPLLYGTKTWTIGCRKVNKTLWKRIQNTR